VGYWGLDESGGANNALDKHSGSRTVTQFNSPGSGTGKVYSGARTFNGSSQYFTRDSETSLQGGDNDITWAAWVYLGNVAIDSCIIGKYNTSSAQREYLLMYNYYDHSPQARLCLFASGDGATNTIVSATTFGAPSANTWYLVIAWHDAVNNQIAISINNGTADTASFSSGLNAAACPFQLGTLFVSGSPFVGYYLNGRMGPAMMWKSTPGNGGVLTSTQRTALYNAGAGLTYASFTS
jgi:hypothetical protein